MLNACTKVRADKPSIELHANWAWQLVDLRSLWHCRCSKLMRYEASVPQLHRVFQCPLLEMKGCPLTGPRICLKSVGVHQSRPTVKTALNIIQNNENLTAGHAAASQYVTQFVYPECRTAQLHINELRAGYAEISANAHQDKTVGNADGRFRNSALAMLASAAAGVMLDATAPEGCTWSMLGLAIDYIEPAVNEVIVCAGGDSVDWERGNAQSVPVKVKSSRGEIIACAELKFMVSSQRIGT